MRRFVMVHDLARQRAIQAVKEASEGWEVTVKEPTKSRGQEERYHAMIGDIADQWHFLGRKWSHEDMKRLCLDQFRRDTRNDEDLAEAWKAYGSVDMAPSLDGTGVVALGVQSRRFPKKLASAFIEWLFALGAEHDVSWTNEHQEAA